jgi:hypothetical protein
LKLINLIGGNSFVCEKTHLCCWHDTEPFDNIPFFIVDKYCDGKYYVFGCFCSVECALAYNLNMGDYRMNSRNSLTRKLAQVIFGDDINLQIAQQKELLQKFGGPLTITQFRDKNLMCKKEFKMQIPPMMPLISIIEEHNKDENNNKKYRMLKK